MHNLSVEERDLVIAMQNGLAEAKADIRRIIKDCNAMMEIQLNAGRAQEANALLRLRGSLKAASAELDKGHADASDALCDCFEEGGEIVALGGGGGR